MTWRAVMTLQLVLFNMGIVLFTLIPFETLIFAESIYAFAASVALVGVVCHGAVCTAGKWAWTRWAYLLTGWIAFSMFFVYEYYAWVADGPLAIRAGIGLFLLSGAAGGYGAHLVDGGHGLD